MDSFALQPKPRRFSPQAIPIAPNFGFSPATPPFPSPIRPIGPLPSKGTFPSRIPRPKKTAVAVSTVSTVDPFSSLLPVDPSPCRDPGPRDSPVSTAHLADRPPYLDEDLLALQTTFIQRQQCIPKAELPSRPCPECHIPTVLGTRAFFAVIESTHGKLFTTLLYKYGIADDEDLRLLLDMHSSRNIRLTGMFDENKVDRIQQKRFWAQLMDISNFARPQASTCLTPSCIELSKGNDLEAADPRFYFLMKKLGLEKGRELNQVVKDGHTGIATPFELVVLTYLLRVRLLM